MDNNNIPYSTFPFDWTVKSSSYQIQYRIAFNINEIEDIFCSIINAKGNEINFSELAILLGFNLQDLAEIDILYIYLKGLTEFKLIDINQDKIQLTVFGQEALYSKLKYKYFFATTALFENQQATGEKFDFPFKDVFDLENGLSLENKIEKPTFENPELKQKLQFQLFGNDFYKGEIIELYESSPYINYKCISLQCEITSIKDSFHLSLYKSNLTKPDLQFLIDKPENTKLKSKLIKNGMYHHILSEKHSITVQDIEMYIDLWIWKELAENPKIDWNDKNIFELFRKNGNVSVWNVISEKAPIESIKSVIQEYAEYWNWNTLTERFDNGFIKEQIEKFNWDFEELSYKETELVISLLSNSAFKDCNWDWNYLSKKLSDKFIEENIENFNWDFYEITVSKNDVFKNTFIKYRDKLENLISKSWNWQFISEELNLNFLHKNISELASKLDWHIVLNRFFNNLEITVKCLKEESFKSLLIQYLPDNFVVAHQKYLWTTSLIDFFDQQNLIQWESKTYINGFETNENVEWNRILFQKYQSRISTEKGFLNISKRITDYTLIEDFHNFAWNWEGISQNSIFLSDALFIKRAFTGELKFSRNLDWAIILNSITNLEFINKHLDTFYKITINEDNSLFWNILTKRENHDYIFANIHFPWDWSFITVNSTEQTILDSFEVEELFVKWDWEIATRKLDKESILNNLEKLAHLIDWKFLINVVFTIENELSMDKQLPIIADCLFVVNSDKRKEFWKDLTAKFSFEVLSSIVEATYKNEKFKWDWDLISNHQTFQVDIKSINTFKHKINWDVFSENVTIKKIFEYQKEKEISYNDYFKSTLKYLKTFNDFWNWNILTRNSNLHYNREIIKLFLSKWDWIFLSEFGGFLIKKKKDKENYLTELLSDFPQIEFEFLSKRKDINIDSSLIIATKDKKWNWQALSENEKAEISNELILELKEKDWDWQALSKRKNIDFSNDTLLKLIDKEWDWNYLSQNPKLVFSAEFIEKTKAKSWNWKSVSRHNTFEPTVEILTLTNEFELDWEYLSKHSSLNPTKELLVKFETKWDWNSITKNLQINFDDIDFIERFADKWNWRFICESGKLRLNNQILNKFKAHLEWNLISSNTNIHFTKEIIQEFKQYWNWSKLKENKRVEEFLGSYVVDEIKEKPILTFIDRIEQQSSNWKGSIYHFSHIDNAVQIIREKKVKSRKTANQLSDSAGNVVYSRTNAHSFARFYFRPHTQTQFYNENLGIDIGMGYMKDGEWHSWYDKEYRLLDFPKCPKPIYFEFSLQEVLFSFFDKCNISTGNMQRNKTKFGKIEQMIHLFNFQDLFINPGMDSEEWKKFREYAQQEFMVEKELDFSSLNYFKIICTNEDDRTLLIQLLGEDSIEVINNMVIDDSYYRNENPAIHHYLKDNNLIISSNKQAEGYFILTGYDISLLNVVAGDIIKQEVNKITFKSSIEIINPLNIDITVKYIDEINQEWFVCSNFKLKKQDYEVIRSRTTERKELRVGQFHNNIF